MENLSAAAMARSRSGGSSSTRPRINRKKKDDATRRANAAKRCMQKLGGVESAQLMKHHFDELEKNRKPVGCAHDTADGLLIGLIVKGFSQRELHAYFGIGGYRHKRIVEEMKHP